MGWGVGYSVHRVNIAILGLGSIGHRHARNFHALGCSVQGFDVATSPNTPLESALDGCQAAIIATPPESHVELAWAALSAGCHVLCEKPLSVDMAETGLLLSRFRQAGKVFAVGYPWRYDRSMNEKRRRVLEDIGPVQRWNCRYAYNTPNETALRMGALLDCSHAIDFLRWILGEPAGLTAAEWPDRSRSTLTIRFGLASGMAYLSLRAPLECRWEIVGAEGAVDWIRARDVDYNLNETYLAEAAHFLACCRGEAQPLTDGWDARETLRIALAARKAAQEGRWIAR